MTEPALRLEGLTKRYGTATVLDSVDLSLAPGEVLGYLGPNGAGKSTTIGLVLGLLRPSAGRALVFGVDTWRGAARVARRVAYVPSEANLWPRLTGAEVLELLGRLHGDVDVDRRDELIGRFALDPNKRVRALSHGNRQKVLLVAAFSARADLLVLDEPTTGLDPLMEQVFRACVREARDDGRAVLLSSHVLSEVEAVSDRVALLHAGRLIEEGRIEQLRGLAAVHVRATVAGPTGAVEDLAAIENFRRSGDDVSFEVRGDVAPVLEALVAVGVTSLTVREPSLEELFVSRYGTMSP